MNTAYSEEQKESIQALTLLFFTLLLSLNISFIAYTLVTKYKEKKRKKAWEQRRQAYEQEIERNKNLQI